MAAQSEGREIRSLTGLRGVAALFVAFYHLGAVPLLSGHAGIFMRHGYLAVDLFFVLSGFVMAMVYGPLFTTAIGWRDCRTFMIRRIARVYPLYFVLLPIGFSQMLAGYLLHYTGRVWAVCLAQLFLVQAWGVSISVIGPAWSISTELAAYLFFPFLYLATAGAGWRGLAMTLAGVLAVFLLFTARSAAVGMGISGPLDIWWGTSIVPLCRCLIEFTIGVLTWHVAEKPAAQRFFRREWLSFWIFGVIVALLSFDGSDGSVVLCFPALLLSLRDDRSELARLLGSAPVHRLGDLSYALYLLHYFFRLPSAPATLAGSAWLLVAVKIAAVLVFASIAHGVVEKPGRRVLRRLLEPSGRTSSAGNPNLTPP